jgi:predicted transcriptional regulator of viral defense system
MRAAQFVDELVSRGIHHFTTQDALLRLNGTEPAVRAQLRRLKAANKIASPMRSFYVVVSPEYRKLGCLPAEHFIDQLMTYLAEPYYVGLLSAAERYGAAHQRPQTFQVVVPRNRPPIRCGKVDISFIARGDTESVTTRRLNTAKGFVYYSTPEQTSYDLVGYPNHAGGLSNVATVLSELASELDRKVLLSTAGKNPVGWSQRLGFLLEVLGEVALSSALEKFVNTQARSFIPLRRSVSNVGAERNHKWKVIINEKVEPDL